MSGVRARTAAALASDAWISEGNFRQTFDLRLPRADLVIILEPPRRLRLVRVFRRVVTSNRGVHGPQVPVIRLRTSRAVARFLASLDE